MKTLIVVPHEDDQKYVNNLVWFDRNVHVIIPFQSAGTIMSHAPYDRILVMGNPYVWDYEKKARKHPSAINQAIEQWLQKGLPRLIVPGREIEYIGAAE